MRYANNKNNIKTFIDDAVNDDFYVCPSCGAPLDIRNKGTVRAHCFAHKKGLFKKCNDTWESKRTYCISDWHNEWQDMFPKENQEVVLSLGSIKHRADVMVGNSIIEFQHSNIKETIFEERNNFYINSLGYKVVWIFDLTKEEIKFEGKDENQILHFIWNGAKPAFNTININKDNLDHTYDVELFFEINNSDTPLIKVIHQEHGYMKFEANEFLSKNEFLEYIGYKNGVCPTPDLTNTINEKEYEKWKNKYNIVLNKTQERALQAINGSVLLLSVPGSGKTSVLIQRLGYMTKFRGIDANRILALTFSKNAASEMEDRYKTQFGIETEDKVSFKTIHSFAYQILSDYSGKKPSVISDYERENIIQKLYKDIFNTQFVYEQDIKEVGQTITFIKNSMKSEYYFDSKVYCLYKKYIEELRKRKSYDFDDLLVYAYKILSKEESKLEYWRHKYDYILVDEAQDTSRIQHEIIKMISYGNNIFMVGDEDQSIYGFRAADPIMLENFKYNYLNPFVLKMETNYRSTPEIVEKAQKFISKLKGRNNKNMISNREHGDEVKLIKVDSREDQYDFLVEVAKNIHEQTAFLYRNNESSVVLIDKLLRAEIPYKLESDIKLNFFKFSTVNQIKAYLSLSINRNSSNAYNLERIINKGILYLNQNQKMFLLNNLKNKKNTITYELIGQAKFQKHNQADTISKFITLLDEIKNLKPYDAIEKIINTGYGNYLKTHNMNAEAIESLKMIAKNEDNIYNFLERVDYLEGMIEGKKDKEPDSSLIISTIHSSKGLEYNSVYIVDAFDDNLPSDKPMLSKYINRDTKEYDTDCKDSRTPYSEERRIFYVGITRAKDKLALIKINNHSTSFIDEIFGLYNNYYSKDSDYYNIRINQQKEIRALKKKTKAEKENIATIAPSIKHEERAINYELMKSINSLNYYDENNDPEAKLFVEEKFKEVINSNSQFRNKIIDKNGIWWKKCGDCGVIRPADKFEKDKDPVFGFCLKCNKK